MKKNDKLILETIANARKLVKENNQLQPVFFIGGEMGVNIVAADFRDEHCKDVSALVIKKMAHESKADFILFISESWTVPPECANEYMTGLQIGKYKTVKDHPKAYDIIWVTLETKTSNSMGMAKLLPGRVMGEVEWLPEGVESKGRFVNLLGPKPTRH